MPGLIVTCALSLAGCGGPGPRVTAPVVDFTPHLSYLDLVVGTGGLVGPRDDVTVHYVGWILHGEQFDSSYDRGEPFSCQLGVGQVIRGFDEGVPGMRVGGKRRITMPPAWGYGSRGAGPIPPNATLVFEVEVLGRVPH